jgi:BirA family biotin operon repressor/biotin-[acetyl-CoA-carboxylase] ligase
MLDETDKLNPAEIKLGLKTRIIGNEIVYFDKTESTNKAAKELAKKGAEEGIIVIAGEQTKGRGRLDRKWLSAPDKNILMSLLLRPELPPSKAFLLTMMTSIAIVKAIKKETGLNTLIKWPNDIYYNNKKLAGILTELNSDRKGIKYTIIGIGLNVNLDPDNYIEIREIATSLYKETGKIIFRNNLLRRILIEIEKEYNLLKRNKINEIRREWTKRSMVLGKSVTLSGDDYSEEGIAESINEDGSLILIKSDGKRKTIVCGDISLRLKSRS